MKGDVVLRLLSRLCAAELVRAAYSGVLGRPADDEGLKIYSRELAASQTGMADLLATLSRSQEHWKTLLVQRVDELVNAAFRGLLHREPRAHEITPLLAQFRKSGDISGLLAAISGSQEHWELLLERRSAELVVQMYRSTFGRDPDSAALECYTSRLKEKNDIAGVVAALATSRELWEKQLELRAEELVRGIYRSLLDREPEDAALKAYSGQLKEHRNLGALLRVIGRSSEHWEVLQQDRAEELVRIVFAALLNREPDEQALQTYTAKLRTGMRLTELLAAIARSQEHWEQLLDEHAHELIGAVYRGLLSRPADSVGLSAHLAQFKADRDLATVASAIGRSRERDRRVKRNEEWPHPGRSYEATAWVFVHVQKTGGTSLQNMIVETFGDENVYHEHDDSLHLHCPAELSQYSVFAGHFNHDSLAYIPRRKLNVFALVREPRQRLVSLYNFWRAHEDTAPGFHDNMRLAREVDIATFYGCPEVARRRSTWNHMTWCLMGNRQWRNWRALLSRTDPAKRAGVIESLRPAIRQRLRELCFVGLQEDFAGSCRALFQLLGQPCPEIRADHSVAKLSSIHSHIRRTEKPALTERALESMANMVELDTIVYEEAKILYAERSGETLLATRRRTSKRLAASSVMTKRAKARGA